MIDTIQNEHLCLSVNSFGAEMCSISAHDGAEYLWQGDPTVWKGQSPILFPFIGKLKSQQYIYNNETYQIAKHGFARTSEFFVTEKTANTLCYCLKSSEFTKKQYPFDFELYITYTLVDNAIIIAFKVINKSLTDMLFSIGAHPAISCLWGNSDDINDYYLEFDKNATLTYQQFNATGLARKEYNLTSANKRIELTNSLFDNDALIFPTLKSNTIALKSKLSEKQVMIDFPNFTYLGLWSKPAAPFLCIEPWFGVDDYENATGYLDEKEGIEILPANKEFNCDYKITIS